MTVNSLDRIIEKLEANIDDNPAQTGLAISALLGKRAKLLRIERSQAAQRPISATPVNGPSSIPGRCLPWDTDLMAPEAADAEEAVGQ